MNLALSADASADHFVSAFAGYEPGAALRRLSETFCRKYEIADECAPVYVATLAAVELGMGDGGGVFWERELPPPLVAIEKFATKLLHHFWSFIKLIAPRTTIDDIVVLSCEALSP